LARKVKIAAAMPATDGGGSGADCSGDDPATSGNTSYKGRIRCRNRSMAAIRLGMHGFVLFCRIFCQIELQI
jgi:hypothetical protein